MTTRNMIQALNDAHHVMMERDDNVVVMGEDAGYFGGVFRVTEHLQKKFGKTRVFDTLRKRCQPPACKPDTTWRRDCRNYFHI